jgi:hypothetical protein
MGGGRSRTSKKQDKNAEPPGNSEGVLLLVEHGGDSLVHGI